VRKRVSKHAILALVLLAVAVLGVVGRDVESKLSPISLGIPGTPSAHGEELADRYFGDSTPVAILLQGPPREVERQGRRLVASLRRDPDATTISPWDRGAMLDLRRGPRQALILVNLHVSLADAMRDKVTSLEATLEEVRPPLQATHSGFATISRALQVESERATQRAELLAIPLLILVLLLVFRSLAAAAIPLVLGAMTVLAGRGVLALLTSLMTIDSLSLVVCTMMGLALGVDYSLLIVSRFREELASGHEPAVAAQRSRASAGRTTMFAGATLFISIFVSAFLQPGLLLVSLATALVVVTAISVILSALVLPPFLALLGERINAGRIPRRSVADEGGEERSRIAAIAGAALRRPVFATVLVSVPLLLLALPALGFTTGSPGVDQLPADSPARLDAEAINAAVGPGWTAPFELVVASPRGPMTTPSRLALLRNWQRRIARDRNVQAVVGPSAIARSAVPLRQLGNSFGAGQPNDLRDLAGLGRGLGRTGEAVARLRSGLDRASDGSGQLSSGAAEAEQGARLLAVGVDRAKSGGAQAGTAAQQLAAGSDKLVEGQRQAGVLGLSLVLGLRSLLPALRKRGTAQARQLSTQLEAMASEDQRLRQPAARARRLAQALAASQAEVRRLRGMAINLNGGLDRLAGGGERLQSGAGRLAAAVPELEGALGRLSDGTHRLSSNLSLLEGGARQLQQRLDDGYQRSRPLWTGLERARERTARFAEPLARASRLRQQAPGLFDSGYFVLSALDGAPPSQRMLAGEAINISQGGQAARMLVISNRDFNTGGSRQIGQRLVADAQQIEKESGLQAGVTGGAAILTDYGRATQARLPLVIGAVVLITFLMLIAILRAPLLAALAIGLNLASVAAALGVMTLVGKIPEGLPLGGHPYIDTIGAASIFGVTFGLSIDYAVFLLARIKERHDQGADHATAIAFGLDRTAAVITGAAAIMSAVFVCFAIAPIATVGQMGIGLTVAILIDATIVRIVLLPCLMLLIGERVWYVPPVLDRLLPRLNVGHGPLREREA
jgi:putative drug exporter of the RND superfamily